MFGQWALLAYIVLQLLIGLAKVLIWLESPNRDSYVLIVFYWPLIESILSKGTFILVHHLVGIIPPRVFPLIKGFPSYISSVIMHGYISLIPIVGILYNN